MAIIMARSGRFENISIQAAGFAGDPPGQMGPLETVKLSNTCHGPPGSVKWGDYFTAVPDPSGDGTFWGFAAYMIDNVADPGNPTPGDGSDDGWGTWIFHFAIVP